MDPSKGAYQYKMDILGAPQNILWDHAHVKYRTGPWDALRFSGVPEIADCTIVQAWKFWEEGKAIHLADETIVDISSFQSELARCVHVGLLCVQECADDRSTMSAVVLMLSNEAINLTEPKKPVICQKITDKFKLTDELALCEYQFYSISEEAVSEIEGR